jgi:hypothetical protein
VVLIPVKCLIGLIFLRSRKKTRPTGRFFQFQGGLRHFEQEYNTFLAKSEAVRMRVAMNYRALPCNCAIMVNRKDKELARYPG